MQRIMFFLLMVSMPCYATIYMAEDAKGNITYSDTPSENSRVLSTSEADDSSASFQVTPELSTTPQAETHEVASSKNDVDAEQPAVVQYRSFAIISPRDQENIHNQPTLPVEVKVDPKLQKGDKIQVLLDGKLMGNPSETTRIELGFIERGTHTLSAVIINAQEQVLQQTNPITIYVNRVNVNFKPGNNPPPPSSNNESSKKGLVTTIKELFS